jgi:hypothetical protein
MRRREMRRPPPFPSRPLVSLSRQRGSAIWSVSITTRHPTMSLSKKSNGKANAKYFESHEILKQLEDVKEWLHKNVATKKVRERACH